MDMSEAWLDTFNEEYTSVPTWNDRQKSLEAAEAPSLKVSSYATSKIIPTSTKITLSYAMKRGVPKSEFPIGGKTFTEQTLVSEEKNKSKSRTMRKTVWKLTISELLWILRVC